MKIPKYSKLENERRFFVGSLTGLALPELDFVHISDLYIDTTHMRLRSVSGADGSIIYKLCKKYPKDNNYSGPIVNTYLSVEEYAVFNALPGRRLNKKRYRISYEEIVFGVDVFEGQLGGLILCEVEMQTREQLESVRFPAWAKQEVTEDDFFTGGHLSRLTANQLQEKLLSVQP